MCIVAVRKSLKHLTVQLCPKDPSKGPSRPRVLVNLASEAPGGHFLQFPYCSSQKYVMALSLQNAQPADHLENLGTSKLLVSTSFEFTVAH